MIIAPPKKGGQYFQRRNSLCGTQEFVFTWHDDFFFFFFTNPGFVGTEIFMTKVEDSLRKRTQNYENKITTFALDGAI